MGAVTLFIGLARQSEEISHRGYQRQPLVLSLDADADTFSNRTAIAFDPALSGWGLIDGFTLSTSPAGPVVAVSPLLLPVFIRAGQAMQLPPGCVLMNRSSADAILNPKPVLIGSRQSAA